MVLDFEAHILTWGGVALMPPTQPFLDAMKIFKSDLPMCPTRQPCSQWARNYMKYCLCSRKDWISLILGIVSIVSWGVAEVPQIITNFKEKSSEGLAIGFLMTWILGDILNVLGCYLEPATLPTQYYTAVLYLVTTLALSSQSIYYGHFRHHGTSKRQGHEIESADKKRECSHDGSKKQLANGDIPDESTVPMLSKFTQSLPILAVDDDASPERAYYTYLHSNSVKQHEGIVMQVGRKLLQGMESNGIGTFLGWGMAAIYIGGRLPQIFLNGLNPLMFMFALLGNSTYVASILVSTLEWSKIKPNLPWLIESSGCMLLDTFVSLKK
ncbi:Cystinosin/ERS1p repeat-containing protein [Cynara cardunculus var. scolymus]|uniref:Cystinosin/ERS1p repeat-containing protein n=1 Tax=Cynara cardunculus var. scolymus TaxID=59895 RepID=A0A124SIB4_CYNCS|nr:Cystinosin/ERS1p repeat-containing protein [Cynara cardunculus var. scolymus]